MKTTRQGISARPIKSSIAKQGITLPQIVKNQQKAEIKPSKDQKEAKPQEDQS